MARQRARLGHLELRFGGLVLQRVILGDFGARGLRIVPDRYVGRGCRAESHGADDRVRVVWSKVQSYLRDGAVVGEPVVHVH